VEYEALHGEGGVVEGEQLSTKKAPLRERPVTGNQAAEKGATAVYREGGTDSAARENYVSDGGGLSTVRGDLPQGLANWLSDCHVDLDQSVERGC
jgi:hypothetical protein